MSNSSLWSVDKEFMGEELVEFKNSWLFAPIVWDVLFEKYMPEKVYGRFGKQNFMTAIMFDETIEQDLVKRIDGIEDEILWCMASQYMFDISDKDLIVRCIRDFLKVNEKLTKQLGDHIQERFNEVADAINNLDEKESSYFIFKNTSCDDNVEYWFEEYNEEIDEYENSSLLTKTQALTLLVVIENNKVAEVIPNNKLKEYLGLDNL